MADTEKEIKLGFDKGLLESLEESLVPVGYSVVAKNWLPEPTGGVRARRGWIQGSTASAPATRAIAGIGEHAVTSAGTTTGWHLVANADGTDYRMYSIDRTALAAGTWSNFDTVAVANNTPVAFASGLGYVLYTNLHWSAIRRWDSTTAAAIAGAPAGQALAFHKNRFFTGGTIANPSRLWFSDLATTATWPATNYIDINRDDGEYILDAVPFEDGLLVAKSSSLHYMSGTSPDTFSLHKLNSGGGYTGRCIAATPYGAVVAGQKEVYLWTGGGVDVISKPVETSYSLSGRFVTTTYVDGVCYICDEGTGRVFCVALADGVWWTETLETVNNGPAALSSYRSRLLYGPKSGNADVGPLQYRDIPGSARGKDFGTLAEQFSVHTPEMWLGGPNHAITPRHLYVRVRQRGGDASQTGLTITPVYDGIVQTALTIPARATAQTFRTRLDVGSRKGAHNVKFKFDQLLPGTHASVFDIEEVVLGYNEERR